MITKIISSGQTGADLAALDVALANNIPHGGWIPKGRLTENGPLDEKYQLQETETDHSSARTEKNILESNGTLILSHGPLTGGAALSSKLAQKLCKPLLHLDMHEVSMNYAVRLLKIWLQGSGVQVLNVTSCRASKDPKIYDVTVALLTKVLQG